MITASLGVGCFHFAPGEAWKGKNFDLARFANQLQKALETESNINNVHLEGIPGVARASVFDLGSVDDVPDIARGPDLFPHLGDATISFDVFIPFRLQKELHGDDLRTGTENFHVSITYDWHFPVAFVEPVATGKAHRDPSDGVVCVRKFLERQLGKGRNSDVQFQSLGPSPFHADFTFGISTDDTVFLDEYECSIVPLSGYDLIDIQVKTSDPVADAKRRAFQRIGKELEFYYEVVQARVMNLHTWIGIEEAIDGLRTKSSLPTIRRALASFGIQRLIDEALFLTTDLERRSINVGYRAKNWRAELEQLEGKCFLWSYIEKEVEAVSQYPVEQMLRLVNIFEERRKLWLQNAAVVLGALAGGVVGAALTILIGLFHR